jgi:hypothetical protein
MSVHRYVASTVQLLYGGSTAGVSGGSGTFAIAAGGTSVMRDSSGTGWTDDPVAIPLTVQPSDSDDSYMLISAPIPEGSVIGIRDAWVTYWQED